jgi:hypothetical protein
MLLLVSSMLSQRTWEAIRPAVRQLARITANVLLAYAWGGLWAFAMIAIAERFDPDVTGVLGLVGSWVWTMFWLLVGAPFVIGALAIIDLALYRVPDARLAGRVVSLLPGAAATVLALVEPAGLPVALWLIATGLAFGHSMRLPPPARSSVGWR